VIDTKKLITITMNNGTFVDGTDMQKSAIHGQLNKPIDIEKLLALMQQLLSAQIKT